MRSTVPKFWRCYSTTKELPRINEVGIQYISSTLHNKVFPGNRINAPSRSQPWYTPEPAVPLSGKQNTQKISLARKYLSNNELLGKKTVISDPIAFDIPSLEGDSLDEHFHRLGLYCAEPYLTNATQFAESDIPKPPKEWIFQSGWTRYGKGTPPQRVAHPLEATVVFDVECLYKLSPYPVMATAASDAAWYGWVSPFLTEESSSMEHLVPMGTRDTPRLIIGHNVGYDRSCIEDEYHLKQTKAFYLDTMSLHVATNGLSSRQRLSWMLHKKKVRTANEWNRDEGLSEGELTALRDDILNDVSEDPWLGVASMNSLAHVAELHCGITMNKADRDYFSLEDPTLIRENFARLMAYCAGDVLVTFRVYAVTFPCFRKTVPHPVSFAALRQMGSSFLPTTRKWDKFIEKAEAVYQKNLARIEQRLRELCEEALAMKDDPSKPWEKDPWLSQLDWTMKPIQYNKDGSQRKRQRLPGYPEWYKALCSPKSDVPVIGVKTRTATLLFRLRWEGHPVVWLNSQGWCFAVPLAESEAMLAKTYQICQFQPSAEAVAAEEAEERQLHQAIDTFLNSTASKDAAQGDTGVVLGDCVTQKPETDGSASNHSPPKPARKRVSAKKDASPRVVTDFCASVAEMALQRSLKGSTHELFRIPHPEGPLRRCAFLVTKPYLKLAEKGIITSEFEHAQEAYVLTAMAAYWVSSRARIALQFVVYNDNNTRDFGTSSVMGIILPRIQAMGTVTRRAVENTWLTASNAKRNRIGSELKALVEAPPGYCFVGADVDSEELWIASLVGDSLFKIHGGTALGWMTLEGTKSEGTDLHSKTANILGISRNEAKIFNYGRIYGAGLKFACTLLKQFNPSLTETQAKDTAQKLYDATKGIKLATVPAFGNARTWFGGSESVVFNRLEMIAEQETPRTPILGAGITQALTRKHLNANIYLPSRINWAIQSSGVDYLHLLLVGMEYLIKRYKVEARLLITVHDEVRYMVKNEDRYRVTLLMQICNLWTRAMFAEQLGISEIPQSCAFFSAVDVDHVLRKEVDMDCVTPSNTEPISPGESLTIEDTLAKCSGLGEDSHPDLSAYTYTPRTPVFADIDNQLSPELMNCFIELQVSKDRAEFDLVKWKTLRLKPRTEPGLNAARTKPPPVHVAKPKRDVPPSHQSHRKLFGSTKREASNPEFEEGPMDPREMEMLRLYEMQMSKRKRLGLGPRAPL